jgi:hypothetical protein
MRQGSSWVGLVFRYVLDPTSTPRTNASTRWPQPAPQVAASLVVHGRWFELCRERWHRVRPG